MREDQVDRGWRRIWLFLGVLVALLLPIAFVPVEPFAKLILACIAILLTSSILVPSIVEPVNPDAAKSVRMGFNIVWLLALGVFLIAPFVWMILISLRESNTPIPSLYEVIPENAHWENYAKIVTMEDIPVLRFFWNSVFVSVSVVLGQLLVCSMAAYAFSRLKFKGRDSLFMAFLFSMMFGGPVVQIPVYLMMRGFGWLDTYAALIVPGVSSAFNVFLFRQFFMQIPMELDEAARIDGAGEFRIYWKVILPLSKAALATGGAFTFFAVWTDFFWPLLVTNSMEMRTLEVGLSVFKTSYGNSNWPLQMTAAVVVLIPMLLVFLFTQRFFTKGVVMGSVK
ncbi:MAG: carbohydrate ABC transporter permease [Fimbriimonadaceae bacterium]|nr:carbohydrate ABC transporter permease [Fimbriimonadaceae bacterium]